MPLPATLPECSEHGVMTVRPLERQTPEQLFCGTWYDCPQCTSSALLVSSELATQLRTGQYTA